jgi:Flp pilus assembly secretin CpaC
MTIAKIPPNEHAVKAGEIKDKIRMTGSARKASEVQRKKRVAQRQAKLVREQEAREREGGPSYASGAFNEEATLGPKPAKRRRKVNK